MLILRQIKLLRKLGLPLEEIRKLQAGGLTIQDAMERHQVSLNRQRKSLAQSLALCQDMSSLTGILSDLDPVPWLERMNTMEQEGTSFMNAQKTNVRTKYIAPTIAAVVTILFMGALIALFAWCALLAEDPMPWWLMVFFDIPCIAVAAGVLLALLQRAREIQENELEKASKY